MRWYTDLEDEWVGELQKCRSGSLGGGVSRQSCRHATHGAPAGPTACHFASLLSSSLELYFTSLHVMKRHAGGLAGGLSPDSRWGDVQEWLRCVGYRITTLKGWGQRGGRLWLVGATAAAAAFPPLPACAVPLLCQLIPSPPPFALPFVCSTIVFPHDDRSYERAAASLAAHGEEPDGEVLLSWSEAELLPLFGGNRSIARKVSLRLADSRLATVAAAEDGGQAAEGMGGGAPAAAAAAAAAGAASLQQTAQRQQGGEHDQPPPQPQQPPPPQQQQEQQEEAQQQ